MTKTAAPGLAHRPADVSIPLVEGTVGDALRRAAARFPDRRALAWAEGEGLATLTWAELLAEAERVAAWLLQRAAPGDRVAIWSRNSLEWVLAEYGCALAGLVVAGWNPAWTDFECAHARDLTTPALLLAGHDTRGVALLDRARALGAEGRVFPLEDLRALARDAEVGALPQPQASDLFLIQFTSGTTGRAKGASLSHRAALNGAWVRAWGSGVDETDVWVNPSPMSHVGGAVSMVLGALVTGACYTVMPRFEAGELLRLMRLAGATRTGGVPTMLLALLEHPDWAPGSIALRTIGSGGAPVPPSLIERLMAEFGCPVLVAYAQSECPMMASCVPADPIVRLGATVGRPTPHVELKVVDPRTGETVAIDAMGEICVRGPIVMDGYWRMPEATAAAIDGDGFLHTGDLGALDAQGYLRVAGRAREVIIRGGENIYPAEVEDALLAHPAVNAAAVVGAPDARWGQVVCAAVQLKPGADAPTIAALEAHAATRLAHFKTPRRWLFVDAFPLTPSAKIRKIDVEKLFLEEGA